MTKRIVTLFAVLFWAMASVAIVENPRNGFQQYQLDNGLTVYLWEDHSVPEVFGQVVVKVGSVDEPEEYTGLAHYLEHMLFKGTEKISALNWEKEKPLYEEIVQLYDQFNAEKDIKRKVALTQAINEKSIEAAKYYVTDEFSNLTQGYGGSNLNANTSPDRTVFYNEFPADAMEQWMELNSERLIKPVFRSFQAELENVFEEYNMYQDMKQTHLTDFLFGKAYEGTPYARNTIGYPEHLKNPSLSALIRFYETWYVPNNMALILVGNFNADEVKPLIDEKFGRLERRELPERLAYKDTEFVTGETYKKRVSDFPVIARIYKGARKSDADDLTLNFMVNLFNNGHGTGVFDKIMAEGKVSAAQMMLDGRRYSGRIIANVVPYFDMAQNSWESNRKAEKLMMDEVDKIKTGDVPEWLFNSVKQQMLINYSMALESIEAKVNALTETFVHETNVDDIFTERQRIEALTMDDVKRCAAKYFNGEYIRLDIEQGEPKKDKLSKPEIKPIEMPKGVTSTYAEAFMKIPVRESAPEYNDFLDVKQTEIYDGVKMYYTENTKNDVFSLVLKYGIGTEKMPKLKYAAQLLNSAGIAPDVDGNEFRRQLSALGGTSSYSADQSYFYVHISGLERNMKAICNLVMR